MLQTTDAKIQEEVKENFFADTTQLVKDHINDRILLMRLNAGKKVAKVGSGLITGLAIGTIGFLFIIFFSFALGYFLGELLGDIAAGFGIVAGIYLLVLLIIMYAGKKMLRDKLTDKLIDLSFEKNNEEEDEDGK